MKIKLYFGQEDTIKKSGIGRAFIHQKKALELNNIAYTTDKDDLDYDILHINTIWPDSFKMINQAKENIKKISKKLNMDGLRVIAVCQKNNIPDLHHFTVEDEKNMVLLGFIGFLDPPKETAKSSIEKLNKARNTCCCINWRQCRNNQMYLW